MKKEKIIFVYVTCASLTEAKKIARACVKARLAACANIFPKMHSIYRWKGKMEEANEAVLILKTTEALFSKLTARVEKLHSYDVPCIAALELAGLNPEYRAWLLAQTERHPGKREDF